MKSKSKSKPKPNDLKHAWGLRMKLIDEGNKLRAKGNRIWAEGSKLRAEGDKLWAEGDRLWAEAVLRVHGNVTLEWRGVNHCILGSGEEFKD